MISTKPIVVLAVLALAGGTVAQEKTDEQRIAELIEQLADGQLRGQAAHELRRIGEPAVPRLIDSLNGNEDLAPHVLGVLGSLGPDGVSAYPALLDALQTVRDQHFLALAKALGDLAPYARQRGFDAGSASINLAELERVEKAEREGRPPPWGSDDYVVLLARFDSRVDQFDVGWPTERLLDHLRHNIVHLRELAAEILAHRHAQEAIPLLHAALKSRGGKPRGWDRMSQGGRVIPQTDNFDEKVAEAMVAIAPDDPRAVLAYGFILTHDASPVRRRSAAETIGRLDSQAQERAPEALPDLLAATEDKSAAVAREAITALGMIGPAAKDAIPTLEKLAERDDRQIAERAKAALRQVRGR